MFKKNIKVILTWFIFLFIFTAGAVGAIIYTPFLKQNFIKNKYIKYPKSNFEFKNYNINKEIEDNLMNQLTQRVFTSNNDEISYTYESSLFIRYPLIMDYAQYYKLINNQEKLEHIKKRIKSFPNFSSVKLNNLGYYVNILLSLGQIDLKTVNEYLETFWDNDRKIIHLNPHEIATEEAIYYNSATILKDLDDAYNVVGAKLGDFFDLKPLANYLLNNFNFKYPKTEDPDDFVSRGNIVDGFTIIKFIDILPFEEAKAIFLSKKEQIIKWHQDIKNNYFPKLTETVNFEIQYKITLYHILKKYFEIDDLEYLAYIKDNWALGLIKFGAYWNYYLTLLRKDFGDDFVFKNQEFNNMLANEYQNLKDEEIIHYENIKNSIQYLTQYYLMIKNQTQPNINQKLLKSAIDETYNKIYIAYKSNSQLWSIYSSELYWYIIFYKNYDPSFLMKQKDEVGAILAKLKENRLIEPGAAIDLFKAQSFLGNFIDKNASISYYILNKINQEKDKILIKTTEIHESVEILFFSNLNNNVSLELINALNIKINNLISSQPKIWTNPWEIYGLYLYFSEDFHQINSNIKINKNKIINWIKSYLNNYKHINIIGYFYSKQLLNLLEEYDTN